MFSPFLKPQSGNVMIYVLLAIALFGALTVILQRQTEQSDTMTISGEKAELYAMELLDYASSAEGAINHMSISGSQLDDLSFVNPTSGGFNSGSNIHKIYHPYGGGLTYAAPNPLYFTGTDDNPDPGWYIGKFNNVEWTASTAQDVILVAHQISESACAKINEKMANDPAIPALGGSGNPADYFINDDLHSGTNAPFTAAVCTECNGYAALCVSDSGANLWSFYSIIGGQ